MKILTQKLDNKLTLVQQTISDNFTPVKIRKPINHFIVIDCSGSMSSDLPKIRKQLKNKLPNLVHQDDTVTIIWFSGRGQYGVLKEAVKISNAMDLANLNNAIDRFLQPVGLTGFKEPVAKIAEIIKAMDNGYGNTLYSLLFLTDGADNQWRESEILAELKKLEPLISDAAFVEYGWYCNRNLMAKMAETVGGKLIFSESFDNYDPIFEKEISKELETSRKVAVKLKSPAKYNLAYTILNDGSIITFNVEDSSVLVREDIKNIYYVTDQPYVYADTDNIDLESIYGGMFVYSQRMKSDEVYALLKSLGDVKFIKYFTNCFGKQNYTTFQTMCQEAVSKTDQRFVEGKDFKLVPDENAYCVMDLITDLMEDENCYFIPSHPAFIYKTIGAKKVSAADVIKDDEIKIIEDHLTKIKEDKNVDDLKLLMEVIESINSKKQKVNFIANENTKGSPFSSFVWNENRANLSIRITETGKVELPKNEITPTIDSYRYRTYTIIKDGLVNVKTIPARIRSARLIVKLMGLGVAIPDDNNPEVYLLDLTKLPVMNRAMVKQKFSAKDFCKMNYELLKLKAAEKVYNHYEKLYSPKTSTSFVEKYGEEFTAWLKELGITDYNGFNPSVVAEKIGETYFATELNISVKGIANLPSVNEVLKKINENKKLTPREEIMGVEIKKFNDFINTDFFKDCTTKDQILKDMVKKHKESLHEKSRKLIKDVAKIKFAIIVGQVWFEEFEDLSPQTLDINIDDKIVTFNIALNDVEIDI